MPKMSEPPPVVKQCNQIALQTNAEKLICIQHAPHSSGRPQASLRHCGGMNPVWIPPVSAIGLNIWFLPSTWMCVGGKRCWDRHPSAPRARQMGHSSLERHPARSKRCRTRGQATGGSPRGWGGNPSADGQNGPGPDRQGIQRLNPHNVKIKQDAISPYPILFRYVQCWNQKLQKPHWIT